MMDVEGMEVGDRVEGSAEFGGRVDIEESAVLDLDGKLRAELELLLENAAIQGGLELGNLRKIAVEGGGEEAVA
jgi:hypothetical protein